MYDESEQKKRENSQEERFDEVLLTAHIFWYVEHVLMSAHPMSKLNLRVNRLLFSRMGCLETKSAGSGFRGNDNRNTQVRM